MALWNYIILCVLQLLSTAAIESPIVETLLGPIQGTLSKSYNGEDYMEFIGVPYAEPPIGNLRFEEPVPKTGWDGIWIANKTSVCMQISHYPKPEGGIAEGEEDCLHINIYVPGNGIDTNKNLDVMVHIHGGGFMFGSGNCYAGPKYLMDRDIVLVTFNYRVGLFGFLSTEDEVLPGNNGMKDQVLALKWVKNNIKFFGGNPYSVTISGLSAGGASVHMHYLSPMSKGLFNKGISASGCALNPWVIQENALDKTKIIGNAVGCTQTCTKKLIDCLKSRQASQLNEATRLLRPWRFNPFSPLGLVVEKYGKNPFLPDNPYNILKSGDINDVPWIISVTSDEGLYPAADFPLQNQNFVDLEKRWDELLAPILHFSETIDKRSIAEVSQKIKKYYLKNEPITKANFKQLIKLMSDRLFIMDCEKCAHLQAESNKSPVYFYYYTYEGDEMETLAKLFTLKNDKYGVCHGDDMMFIFSKPNENILPKLTEPDENMKDLLIDIWISFAKHSKPHIEEWLPSNFDSDNLVYLHIKSAGDVKLEKTKELGHGSFWNTIPFKENENLYDERVKNEL